LDQFLPLFATNTAVVAAITHSLKSANRTVSDDQRAHLLECVASLDLRQAPGPLADSILQLLDTPSTNVALAAVRAASSLGISGTQEALSAIARDPARSLGLRLEAMREVVRQQRELDSAQMELLIDHLSKTNLPGVRLSVSEVLTSAKLSCAQIETLLKAVRSDPLISPASILDTVGWHCWIMWLPVSTRVGRYRPSKWRRSRLRFLSRTKGRGRQAGCTPFSDHGAPVIVLISPQNTVKPNTRSSR